MFQRFLRWLRPGARPRPDLRFVLHTRAGCHLCDDAWELLMQAQKARGFPLECIVVDTDPALVAAHGDWVPVVTVNGAVRFRGHVNPVLLQRLLDAAPQDEGGRGRSSPHEP